jgi:hypothetical protein
MILFIAMPLVASRAAIATTTSAAKHEIEPQQGRDEIFFPLDNDKNRFNETPNNLAI